MKHHPSKRFAARDPENPGMADRLLDLVGQIPKPRESKHDEPPTRARELAKQTALKTAAIAGTLALPPGIAGWITIAPEMYTVWKQQAQMVSDIAGAYGRTELLSREQMLYCLFGHTAAGAFRDLVLRAGERYLIRRAPVSALYAVVNKIAIRIAQRTVSRAVTRWIPLVGAIGVAGYIYVDTGKVADTAIALFSADVQIEALPENVEQDEISADAPRLVKPRTRKPHGVPAVAAEPKVAKPRAARAARSASAAAKGNGNGSAATPRARKPRKTTGATTSH
jgi:hypothetical protein